MAVPEEDKRLAPGQTAGIVVGSVAGCGGLAAGFLIVRKLTGGGGPIENAAGIPNVQDVDDEGSDAKGHDIDLSSGVNEAESS
jgi:hypothetical protein